MDLLRPIGIVKGYYAESLGQMLCCLMGTGLLGIICYAFIPEFVLPKGASLLLFVISAFLGYSIMFLISLSTGALAICFENSWGIRLTKEVLIGFLSGSLVPFFLLPEWTQRLLAVLPFQGIVYTPIMIYLGVWNSDRNLNAIVMQLLWLVFIVAFTQIIVRRTFRISCENGG